MDGATTATVLFTDVVGSTDARARLGDEVADELRRFHDDTLTRVIDECSGRVVKSLGDGVMAVFDAAADAVAAAVECQQAITAADGQLAEPLVIRVGVSVGDVTFEGDDCFGTTVNEASRLCASAQGGQILVADLVRAMARGRGGFNFESVGSLDLKGLPDPVPACRVLWVPLRPTADAPLPFPPALLPPAPGAYIGRDDIRSTLRQLWDDAKREGPRTALLVGEPGIGKTRTAFEVARSAHDESAIVLFGRCDDELRVPYQPFVEALAWQTAHSASLTLGHLAGELVRLVPTLAADRPDLPPPIVSDPRTEEHRLFEAVASWLIEVAREHGLVLVLDDLHWATKPTLLMLLHLQRAAAQEDVRLLVVGTYRDTDLDRSHPLSSVLADMRRLDGVVRVPVDPLDEGEVVAFVEQAAGHPLDATTRSLALRAHEETEGNPFFVAEVLRHLVESGAVRFVDGQWIVPNPDLVDVPEGVRDVVGQRLSRLSESANEVLRAAAVLGREFDLDLVGAVTGVDEDELLDAVDAASRARLIEEVEADRFRFTHALVRTTLYDELSASRRRRMHRRVLDQLAELHPDDLAALAHHAVEAGPQGGSLSVAIGYVLAAGQRAQAARAHGEAESYFAKALDLLDEDEEPKGSDRQLRALCGLGEAQRDQGDPQFRTTLLTVAQRAIEAGDVGHLVRAALGNTRGFASIIGDIDQERIDVLEAALERATEGPDRALLQAILASELLYDPSSRDRSLALADDAARLAGDSRDPSLEAQILSLTGQRTNVPERWTSLVPVARRLVDAADRAGDPSLRVFARQFLASTHLNLFELDEASAAIDEGRAMLPEGASPFAEWILRATGCQFLAYEGRFDEAERENDEVVAIGERVGAPDAASWWVAVSAGIVGVRHGGRVGDPDEIGAFADQYPRAHSWRSGHLAALASTGRLDECRQVLDVQGLWDPRDIPRDVFWLSSQFQRALLASLLRDPLMGERVLELLLPFDGAACHYTLFVNGPVERARSYAEVACGRLDAAVAELRAALQRSRRSPAFSIMTRVELAEVLAERGAEGDAAEVEDLITSVGRDASAIGMGSWVERIDELRASRG